MPAKGHRSPSRRSSESREPHLLVDQIEELIQVDVGRHVTALFEAARGGLLSAASALAAAPAAKVGLITGFYVPRGSPPAAETDGPVGTALLAKGLIEVGIPCRLATDEPCRGACTAALAGAGAAGVPVDVTDSAATVAAWRREGITHAISIERCGRSADGKPRNMRGLDISSYTSPLDELFTAGPWETIAIGDGGNEIGMGSLSRELIAQHVDHGETIACVTPVRAIRRPPDLVSGGYIPRSDQLWGRPASALPRRMISRSADSATSWSPCMGSRCRSRACVASQRFTTWR